MFSAFKRKIFICTILTVFFISTEGIVPESADEERIQLRKELNETKEELSTVKKDLTKVKKELSSFKEEFAKEKKTDKQPIKTDRKDKILPKKNEVAVSEQKTKSLKKYNTGTKAKGLKIQDLEDNFGKRYAVVIGVNKYQDTGISELSKARNDAKILGKIFREDGQFDQVFVMTDDVDPRNDKENLFPTKLNIEEKLDSVLRFSEPDDLIVFFFSGHGISDPDGNGYLVSVDTVMDRQFNTSVRVQDIISRIKSKNIKKSLIMLDACRDVLYTSKSAARNSLIEKEYADAEVAATFYSTKAGYYSYEDDETDYGVFTKYLVMGLEGKADTNDDGVVAFMELENYVQKGVKEWSTKKNKQQKPYTSLHGEKTGDLALSFSPDKDKKSLTEKPIPKAITRGDVIFRSAFVPGWGQSYAGAKTKGTIYSASAIATLGFFAYNLQAMNKAQSDYNSKLALVGTPLFYPTYFQLRSSHNNLAEAESKVNMSLGILAAFWIWNIVDAGAFTSLPKQDFFTMDGGMRPDPIQGKAENFGTVSFKWRFE